MAVTIEWRREADRQHTGSAELNGVSGTPFIYVHPEDQADAPRDSCAGWWFYNHRDTTESPVVSNKDDIFVMGWMSYAKYQATRTMYRRLGGWRRFAIWLVTNGYKLQDNPGEVFNAPLASSIQPSGSCVYKAYLKFDPPAPEDVVYEVTANFLTHAEGECNRGARIGMGRSILASAAAFDENGMEQGRERSRAQIAFPTDTDRKQSTTVYNISVSSGTTEIHIGTISAGPGYTIASGQSEFHAYAEIEFIIEDDQDNIIVGPSAAVDDDNGAAHDIEDNNEESDEGEDQ